MKNVIIPLTITLVVAMSLVLDGCSADYDRLIQETTKSINKNPKDIEALQTRGRASLVKEDGHEKERAV